MLFILFLICVVIVFSLTIAISNNADWLEKHTKMSGAFVGLLLAAATSLPELISSLTAVILGYPKIAIANILGSNMFNYSIVAVTNLAFIAFFAFNYVKKGTTKIALYTGLIYIVILASLLANNFLSLPSFSFISLSSILIAAIYIWSVKTLDNDESDEDDKDYACKSSVKKVIIISIVVGILLIGFSSMLAKLTEALMLKHGLSTTIAGAVLLGASTSLPELIGALNLMRRRAFDIAVSSVLASNLFNFFVLFLIDAVTPFKMISMFNKSLVTLLVFGVLTNFTMFVTLRYFKVKSIVLYAIPSIVIVSYYGIYLVMFS